jgi:urea transport system ATP-binding protein
VLAVDNLHLYYGASHCLRGVSLKAIKGEITCLLGRNGVGKTSLLRTIMGQRSPRSGKITWEERPLDGLSSADRARRGIGFVPQGREIFPLLTVEENLKTGYAALPRGERSIPAEIFDLFPVVTTMLKRRGGDLSG